jgi:hypothetical protein
VKIDCQTAQELLPAYLVDGLEADEQATLLQHLRECASCQAEADSLRSAMSLMGLAAPDAGEPSPKVKQRVMAAVHGMAKPHRADQSQPRRANFWRWAVIPSAAALLIVVGLGAVFGSLWTQIEQQQARLDRLTRIQTALQQFMLNDNIQTVPIQATDPAAAVDATLYVAEDKVAMSVTGLPPLEGESVYQCWWIDPDTGEMVAGSTFKVDENGAGVWVWSMPPHGEYKRMAITQESQPDHTQAEGPVMLTADL